MMARVSGGDRAPSGEEIVRRARAWIGTPYVHQASCRGAGSDCLGLIRGLWRELHGEEPEPVPPYSADGAEAGRHEQLLEGASRHLARIPVPDAAPGDVLAFRFATSGPARHLGILGACPRGSWTLIHAYSGHGVVESPLMPAWQRRLVAAFRFDRRS
jgi:NlpC/P60 family putative phage cell wall peptidase